MKFRERVQLARSLVDGGLTSVLEEKNGQARKTGTPGRAAKRYWQIIRWPAKLKRNGREYNHVSVECFLDGGKHQPYCKGNERWFCYHAMMSLMTAAEFKGKRATLFQPSDLDKAERYKNLVRGQVYACTSHTSGQLMFAVIWSKTKS